MGLFQRLLVAMMPKEKQRNNYIKKHKVFASIGDDSIFVPRILPSDPKYIKIGKNVVVAARVTFINHDASHHVFNAKNGTQLPFYHGCIEIGDNVFIGSNTTILPNVFIHDNTFIAAGTVVTKDLESGFVWAGVPAKKIGLFDDLIKKREAIGQQMGDYNDQKCWESFYKTREPQENDL